MTDDAFARGILAMRDTLYRVSYGLLRQEADRRDAVQEAIARAWERRHSLREEQYLGTWIVRILINECHNTTRRARGHVQLNQETEAPMQDGVDIGLHDAIVALPEKYRMPVVLHYMCGYSLREVSRMLRIPLGTVGTRLHRARLRLKETLLEWEEISTDA